MSGLDSEGPWDDDEARSRERVKNARARADRNAQQEAQERALNFLQTVSANLDNVKLDDTEFREFMRNSMRGMPGVGYS